MHSCDRPNLANIYRIFREARTDACGKKCRTKVKVKIAQNKLNLRWVDGFCKILQYKFYKSMLVQVSNTGHTHTRSYICTQHYFSPYVQFLQRAACLLLVCLRHTVFTLLFSLALATTVSLFIRFWRSDVKIFRLAGWASQCPPHPLSSLHHQVIRKAYSPPGAIGDS